MADAPEADIDAEPEEGPASQQARVRVMLVTGDGDAGGVFTVQRCTGNGMRLLESGGLLQEMFGFIDDGWVELDARFQDFESDDLPAVTDCLLQIADANLKPGDERLKYADAATTATKLGVAAAANGVQFLIFVSLWGKKDGVFQYADPNLSSQQLQPGAATRVSRPFALHGLFQNGSSQFAPLCPELRSKYPAAREQKILVLDSQLAVADVFPGRVGKKLLSVKETGALREYARRMCGVGSESPVDLRKNAWLLFRDCKATVKDAAATFGDASLGHLSAVCAKAHAEGADFLVQITAAARGELFSASASLAAGAAPTRKRKKPFGSARVPPVLLAGRIADGSMQPPEEGDYYLADEVMLAADNMKPGKMKSGPKTGSKHGETNTISGKKRAYTSKRGAAAAVGSDSSDVGDDSSEGEDDEELGRR